MITDEIIKLIIKKLQDPNSTLVIADLIPVFKNSSQARMEIIGKGQHENTDLENVLKDICNTYIKDLEKFSLFNREKKENLLYVYILHYLYAGFLVKQALKTLIMALNVEVRHTVGKNLLDTLRELRLDLSSTKEYTNILSLLDIKINKPALVKSENQSSKPDNLKKRANNPLLQLTNGIKRLTESAVEKKANSIIAHFHLKKSDDNDFSKFQILPDNVTDGNRNLTNQGLKLLNNDEILELQKTNKELATTYEAVTKTILSYNQEMTEIETFEKKLVSEFEQGKRVPPSVTHFDRAKNKGELGELRGKFLNYTNALTKFLTFYNTNIAVFKKALEYLEMDPENFSSKIFECQIPQDLDTLDLGFALALLGVEILQNKFEVGLTQYFSVWIPQDLEAVKTYIKIILTSTKLSLHSKFIEFKEKINSMAVCKIIQEYPATCLTLLRNEIIKITEEVKKSDSLRQICDLAYGASELYKKYIKKIPSESTMLANDAYANLLSELNAGHVRFLDHAIHSLRESKDFLEFKAKREETFSSLIELENEMDKIIGNLNHTIFFPLGDLNTLEGRLDTQFTPTERAEILKLLALDKSRKQALNKNKNNREQFKKDIEVDFVFGKLEVATKTIDKSCDIEEICRVFVDAFNLHQQSEFKTEIELTFLHTSIINAYIRILDSKAKKLKFATDIPAELDEMQKLEDEILSLTAELPPSICEKKENFKQLGPKLDQLKQNILSVIALLNKLEQPELKGGFLCFHWLPTGVSQLQKYSDLTSDNIEERGIFSVSEDIQNTLKTRLSQHSFFSKDRKPELRHSDIHNFYKNADAVFNPTPVPSS